MKQAIKSWYFDLGLPGEEAIAVVGEGDDPGELVWMTTYAPNRQTELCRLASLNQVRMTAAFS